jgi:hypothetical protein
MSEFETTGDGRTDAFGAPTQEGQELQRILVSDPADLATGAEGWEDGGYDPAEQYEPGTGYPAEEYTYQDPIDAEIERQMGPVYDLLDNNPYDSLDGLQEQRQASIEEHGYDVLGVADTIHAEMVGTEQKEALGDLLEEIPALGSAAFRAAASPVIDAIAEAHGNSIALHPDVLAAVYEELGGDEAFGGPAAAERITRSLGRTGDAFA